MKIDCISDLHGQWPKLMGGDLLLIAGDLTSNDTPQAWNAFFKWAEKQAYQKVVFIAGNHDNWLIENHPKYPLKMDDYDIEYLCDSGCEFEDLKIWGSPWTRTFPGINPRTCAFTADTERELEEKFKLIPDDTDILLTHSPAFGLLDSIPERYHGKSFIEKHVGSTALLNELDRVMPKLMVCGHIHEHGGKRLLYKGNGPDTIVVNASIIDGDYEKSNDGVRVIL